MNNSNIYELVLVISVVIAIIFIMIIINNVRCNKYNSIKVNAILTTIVLFCLGITTSCYTNIKKSYKEVYYLEYTVYYPGNTCKYKVDSCNHIYSYSNGGTNYIRYYSIPKKDTYGIDTTVPILINKIVKK